MAPRGKKVRAKEAKPNEDLANILLGICKKVKYSSKAILNLK